MAFLSKTPRTLIQLPTQNNAIGPGYYNIKTGFDIEHNNSASSSNKENIHNDKYKKPFNSTAERTMIRMGYDNPGPGSYYKNLMHLNINRMKKGLERAVPFQFKENRFKYGEENQSPGPGAYETVTLPNLQLVDVYRKNYNKQEKLVTSPISFNMNKKNKKDSIPGPGSYDINMKWRKNIIDWGKMSIDKQKSNIELSSLKTNEEKEIKINDKDKEKMKISLTKNTTITKTNSLKAAESNKIKNENNNNSEAYTHVYRHSEPSKSQNKINDPIIQQIHYERRDQYTKRNFNDSNFGSCTSRFIKPKFDSSILGPGEYTNNIINPPKVIFQPRKKMNIMPRYINDNNNNGRSNDHYIKTTGNPCLKVPKVAKGFNGSLEKRFPSYNVQETFPGPGSYSIISNTLGFNKNPLFNYKTRSSSNGIEQKRLLCFDIKNEIPPVGSYNTEKIGSIEYKSYQTKKNFIIKTKEPRFGYKKNITYQNPDIGPGSYDKAVSSIHQNIFSFGSCKPRNTNFINPNRNDKLLGPGKYDTSSYFDWNKKSYNTEYNQ